MNDKSSRTKIVVTLGPASANEKSIGKMIREGVDVFRLNFSHGDHDTHRRTIKLIKKLKKDLKMEVAILADLQGPKIRVGEMKNNKAELKADKTIVLTTRKIQGTAEKISIGYEGFAHDVKQGENILLDDGKIKLEVLDTDRKENVTCRIVYGGWLLPRKGVNLPDSNLSLPSLTEKDVQDVNFIMELGVDWVALSFVRKARDIKILKDLIIKHGSQARIIAKIEKPEALREIDDIIDISDALMVARGDLGVEMPFDQIPLIQKDLVKKCIKNAKPVIIATQMMESMINNFRPTRAEANDVANAVLDGADALMLSAETSIGKYPVEAVINMQRIISWTEEHGYSFHREHMPEIEKEDYLPNSICFNAQKMAEQSGAGALVTFTHSGNTVFRVASHRPKARIFAFSDNEILLRQLSLVWGVQAFLFNMKGSSDAFFEKTTEFLLDKQLLDKKDIIIHIGSIPIPEKTDTNMMKIAYA
ncbi:MAG: pyruvate kinase [Bacteroidales bacterium]|nr:pyruvate kinase [Bacteroidales bacterium]MCF8386894.1 pyruvate kinase [Bacteroidales bacterium]MCF8399383.1 pyruvate kinase [Bacteroidales bacterium]